jgi:carbon monoxide dehydrogenase subunit G
MEHIQLTVRVNAPAQVVWEQITNWASQSDWMLGTKVTGEGNSIGGKIAAFTGIGPIGFLDTMEITRWEPPFRCDVLHTGRVVRGTGSFQVESIDQQTSNFIWIEDLDLPLGVIGLVGFKILRPFFVFGVQKSLEKFAKIASTNS